MIQEEQHEIPHLKKSHPLFNSLVIKIVFSLAVVLWNFNQMSAFEKEFVASGNTFGVLFAWFVMLLIFLSIVEALGMWVYSLVRSVFMKLRKSN